MIAGLGIDIISIKRIERAYRRRPQRFLRRIFSTTELSLLMPRRAFLPAMAARFAAKEAVMKALCCGPGPVSWKDVEIIAPPGKQPRVRLSGIAAQKAAERGIDMIEISMTHDPPFAGAVAVACKKTPEPNNPS
ncbi:MAG: holo-ACP synthase [Firmicutes bacterium]|nr:holo-ACP synthase [Bacillota bacterium]